jgi:hypothetical protein
MNKQELESLRFPVGRFQAPKESTNALYASYVNTIAQFPSVVAAEVDGLSDEQLSWRYRPDGWCIRQVVHHCADSHMNAFIRFKLALTEHNPDIKPYLEARWAEQPDTIDTPLDASMDILRGLHRRWAILLVNLDKAALHRSYYHPEDNYEYSLANAVALYAWHCRHHLGHIKQAKAGSGRFGVV